MTLTHPMLRLALIAGMSLTLGACQTLSSQTRLSSVVATQISNGLAASLATDAALQLMKFIPVGETIIELDSNADAFGAALENALRRTGYALVSTKGPKEPAPGVPLAYVIDRSDDRLLMRLSTGEIDITRLYSVRGDEAMPASPVTVLRHGDASGG